MARERGPAEYSEALRDSLDIVERLQGMVERLLTLARLDSGQTTFSRDTVRLAELVQACWEPAFLRAAKRGVAFENRIPRGLSCRTDEDSLLMVLANLMENAKEYTNERGRIWASGREVDDGVEIAIANTGCTLTEEERAEVFERFWRADISRKDTGLHCGLGLTLARRLVTALGGEIGASVDGEGVFSVTILLRKRGQATFRH